MVWGSSMAKRTMSSGFTSRGSYPSLALVTAWGGGGDEIGLFDWKSEPYHASCDAVDIEEEERFCVLQIDFGADYVERLLKLRHDELGNWVGAQA
jgi:hypothetical protein